MYKFLLSFFFEKKDHFIKIHDYQVKSFFWLNPFGIFSELWKLYSFIHFYYISVIIVSLGFLWYLDSHRQESRYISCHRTILFHNKPFLCTINMNIFRNIQYSNTILTYFYCIFFSFFFILFSIIFCFCLTLPPGNWERLLRLPTKMADKTKSVGSNFSIFLSFFVLD